MKSVCFYNNIVNRLVAPFAGAWIEITSNVCADALSNVAPFAGAWIEIWFLSEQQYPTEVAPFAGAWIEILNNRHQ